MMEACDYKYVQKSQIIPFKIKGTRKYEIIGCQFVINMNRDDSNAEFDRRAVPKPL